MTQLFVNNMSTTLNGGITFAATTVDVNPGDGAQLPAISGGDFVLMTIHNAGFTEWEVVQVTGVSTDTLTISRGYEGTQQAWDDGSIMSANLTQATMEALQAATAAAQATADSAQADATSALVSVNESGGGGASVQRIINVTQSDWNNLDESGSEYDMVFIDLSAPRPSDTPAGMNSGLIQLYEGSSTEQWAPPMHIGYNPMPASGIQPLVFRNGLFQPQASQIETDSPRDADPDYGQYGVWHWIGHHHIHILPPPKNGEFIVVIGFKADDWRGYEQRADTSWLVGGKDGGGNYIDEVTSFDWITQCRSYAGTCIYYDTRAYGGMGGTTDGSYGRCFGSYSSDTGPNGSYLASQKMQITTEGWTYYDRGLPHGGRWGGASTSGTISYLWGCNTSSYNRLGKYPHATDVSAELLTLASGQDHGGACSNASQTFGYYVHPGNNLKHKLVYSTESYSSTQADTANFSNGENSNMVMFYDDKGYQLGAYRGVDLSTEVWTAQYPWRGIAYTTMTQRLNANDDQHCGSMCDGGNTAVTDRYKLTHATVTITMFNTRRSSTDTSYWSSYGWMGIFSDNWGASQ